MFGEIFRRLERLEAQRDQTLKVGVVTESLADSGRVRVRLPDADDLITHELPVLFPKTSRDRMIAMPDVGEHVLCAFLASGLEGGFCLGAFYSAADGVPVASGDKWHVAFADGTTLEYDRAGHALTAQVKGDATVTADGAITMEAAGPVLVRSSQRIELDAPVITGGRAGATASLTGQINLDGSLIATGTVIDAGGNTNHHSH